MAKENILVVEPDAEVAALLVLILEEEGFQVATAESLKEATRLLSRFRFELVNSEALGQSDDFEVDPAFLTQLRSVAEKNSRVPIILFSSAFVHPRRVRDLGLADVVPKPFEVPDLLEKVYRLLQKGKALSDEAGESCYGEAG